MGTMRIVIILIVGILSYLIVVLPGYFFIVPRDAEMFSGNWTLTDLPVAEDANTSTKLSVANPGDAPPPK